MTIVLVYNYYVPGTALNALVTQEYKKRGESSRRDGETLWRVRSMVFTLSLCHLKACATN